MFADFSVSWPCMLGTCSAWGCRGKGSWYLWMDHQSSGSQRGSRTQSRHLHTGQSTLPSELPKKWLKPFGTRSWGWMGLRWMDRQTGLLTMNPWCLTPSFLACASRRRSTTPPTSTRQEDQWWIAEWWEYAKSQQEKEFVENKRALRASSQEDHLPDPTLRRVYRFCGYDVPQRLEWVPLGRTGVLERMTLQWQVLCCTTH